jgi:hypothetical protein
MRAIGYWLVILSAAVSCQLAAQIPAVVDANGQLIGTYIGSRVLTSGDSPGAVKVASRTGYTFEMDLSRADLVRSYEHSAPAPDGSLSRQDLFFTSNECSGEAYQVLTANAQSDDPDRSVGGYVFPMENPVDFPRGRYMVAKATLPVNMLSVTIGSYSNCAVADGQLCSCATTSGGSPSQWLMRAERNDPAITGVPNTPWAAPARIEVLPFAAFMALFCDGFEGFPGCPGT